eukprot:11128329-Alexandrium_andersonii.AAC.1
MRTRKASLWPCTAEWGQTSISMPCSSTSRSCDQLSPDGTWRRWEVSGQEAAPLFSSCKNAMRWFLRKT